MGDKETKLRINAAALLRLREIRGLTQEQVANRVGIGLSTYRRYEAGYGGRPVTRGRADLYQNLRAVADFFGLRSLEEVLIGIGIPQPRAPASDRGSTTQPAMTSPSRIMRVPTLRLLYSPSADSLGGPAPAPRVLRAGAYVLGRSTSDEEGFRIIGDPRVSKRHTVLQVSSSGQQVHLSDAGSRNGSFVNGRRVEERALADGDLLRVGDSFLLLRYDEVDPTGSPSVSHLEGPSPALRTFRSALQAAAGITAPALITGEIGSGKLAVAEALHQLGDTGGPFLVLHGGVALPEHLYGCINGTLCVRGGEDLSPEAQKALLRVIDARVLRVAITSSQDLAALVTAGKFRDDLYGRLVGVKLHILPLRDRREDILPRLAALLGPQLRRLTVDLAAALLHHPFRGNDRELRQIAGRFSMSGEEDADLPACGDLLALPHDMA